MTKSHPFLDPMIDNLHASGRLRVWSLIITILGDVVQPRGGAISMADLLAITNHMKIGQGAIRTALSRLAKEKWVISKKKGRTSSYAFGPKIHNTIKPASDMIYANAPTNSTKKWVLAVLPVLRAKERKKALEILAESNAYLSPTGIAIWPTDTAPDPSLLTYLECLAFEGTAQNIPDWLKSDIASPQTETAVQQFIANYKCLHKTPANLSPLDALTARILLLHDWRRLILRDAPVPKILQPEQWSMPCAHILVSESYKKLLPLSEQYWPQPTPKAGQVILATRFNQDT